MKEDYISQEMMDEAKEFWVEGYNKWSKKNQKYQKNFEQLVKDMVEDRPKRGDQLEFDFIRQMEI